MYLRCAQRVLLLHDRGNGFRRAGNPEQFRYDANSDPLTCKWLVEAGTMASVGELSGYDTETVEELTKSALFESADRI